MKCRGAAFNEAELSGALPRGIESVLGWSADLSRYEIEVLVLVRYSSVMVSAQMHARGIISSIKCAQNRVETEQSRTKYR